MAVVTSDLPLRCNALNMLMVALKPMEDQTISVKKPRSRSILPFKK